VRKLRSAVWRKLALPESWIRQRTSQGAVRSWRWGKLNGRRYKPYILPHQSTSNGDGQQTLMLTRRSAVDTKTLSFLKSTAYCLSQRVLLFSLYRNGTRTEGSEGAKTETESDLTFPGLLSFLQTRQPRDHVPAVPGGIALEVLEEVTEVRFLFNGSVPAAVNLASVSHRRLILQISRPPGV
jgi:hypothetical protein